MSLNEIICVRDGSNGRELAPRAMTGGVPQEWRAEAAGGSGSMGVPRWGRVEERGWGSPWGTPGPGPWGVSFLILLILCGFLRGRPYDCRCSGHHLA